MIKYYSLRQWLLGFEFALCTFPGIFCSGLGSTTLVSLSADLGVWTDKSDRAHSKRSLEELDAHICVLFQKKCGFRATFSLMRVLRSDLPGSPKNPNFFTILCITLCGL